MLSTATFPDGKTSPGHLGGRSRGRSFKRDLPPAFSFTNGQITPQNSIDVHGSSCLCVCRTSDPSASFLGNNIFLFLDFLSSSSRRQRISVPVDGISLRHFLKSKVRKGKNSLEQNQIRRLSFYVVSFQPIKRHCFPCETGNSRIASLEPSPGWQGLNPCPAPPQRHGIYNLPNLKWNDKSLAPWASPTAQSSGPGMRPRDPTVHRNLSNRGPCPGGSTAAGFISVFVVVAGIEVTLPGSSETSLKK